MLIRMGEDGSCYTMKTVPGLKNYKDWIRKLGEENYENVKTWIEEEIEEKDRFFVAMLVPKIWNEPLESIYRAVGEDERDAALLLGRIVQAVLIPHEKRWLCAKTDMTKRNFAVAFYWSE